MSAGSRAVRVSGVGTHAAAATNRTIPLMTKAQPKFTCSATQPTVTEPTMAPKSDAICTAATGLPARASLPRMSATAACMGDMKMPVVTPDRHPTAINAGSDDTTPSPAVATPDAARPTIINVRRPIRSDR